ncbi:hypothetical protein GE061_011048 [Apolygus lucorum]|uniref:Uncharacterized protein n=1 Tax=Apolygus lucorum TaxID=248454 RepID=A0A6A4K958_APOLU|nr:hypothetical protein GE061_011048 [Apolygus lucorum]
MNIANRSVHSFTPASRGTNWMASKDDENMIQKPISDSTNNVVRRTFDIIGYLETLHRQDFIHPEWRHYSADHPSGFYLTYRVLHMLLFITIIIFSFIEFDKLRYSEYSVKYIILWIFYFGNFFLIVSCFQSLFGLVVIYKAYRRDSRTMKYYQKSDSYVTGFQKGYATIHSAATTLAIFAFVTSWQLVEDTGGGFMSLDYSYDSSHIINPLAMTLDFLVVGHAFKFKYLILSFGILLLNIVFNYWLYKSRITSRKGNRVIYEYLNWDDTVKAITHAIILLLQCIFIHVILWTIFLCKRYYGVVLNRRRVLGYQVNISRVRMTVTRPPGQSTDYYSGSRIFGGFSQDDISGSPEKKEDDQSGEKTSENSEDSEMGFTLIGSNASLSGETNKTKSPTESKNIDLADQSNITNDTGISDPHSIETTIKAILQEKIRSVSRTSDPNFEKYSMNASTAPTSQDPSQSNVNKLPKSHSSKLLSSIESIWSSATSILKHHKSKTSNPISEVQHGSNNQLKSEESAHTVSTRGFTSGGSGKSLPQESMSSIKPIPATELSNVSIKAESAKAVVGSTPQPEAPHVEDGQVSKSNKDSSSNAGKQPVKTGNNAARSSTDDESTD